MVVVWWRWKGSEAKRGSVVVMKGSVTMVEDSVGKERYSSGGRW